MSDRTALQDHLMSDHLIDGTSDVLIGTMKSMREFHEQDHRDPGPVLRGMDMEHPLESMQISNPRVGPSTESEETMSLDFSGLSDLAKQPEGKPGWRPLTVDDLGYGTVLCFDQSLTATGCVILKYVFPASAPQVVSASQFANPYDGKDVPTSLNRGVSVFEQARFLIRKAFTIGIDAIVHESPPNPNAVRGGGYSSLLAAQALRCAISAENASSLADIEMLGAQPAKKLICGNANAKKAQAHAVLKESVLPWIVNSQVVTNEATRDALMVGLLWLARRKK